MQMRVGAAAITRITEREHWAFAPTELFPEITEAEAGRTRSRYAPTSVDPSSGELVLAIHTYVIRLGGQVIVVDPGNGNHKERPNLPAHHHFATDYPDRFAAAGFDPAEVGLVVSTHLHPDHCGWNTTLVDGRWVPTFPNATHVFFDEELAFVESLAAQGVSDFPALYEDSVQPVLGRARRLSLASEQVLASWDGTEVVAVAAPGHTPGHCVIEIRGRERAVISGDVIHHPVQLELPDLSQAGDSDRSQARRTRAALLARCADEGITLLPAHFPGGGPVSLERDTSGALTWRGVEVVA
ncbi:MBL fold metallo-hydrolase [Amycolatopsis endophytica]|uniref:Glyoxylase-like metal-dependent hydrolase (Beta-lactamase superfamily II) n=1 Tax=Amycolatopsis endophytica TaxID=860233 RepID=A0A853B7A4_9PSEU|nr:MBL fold metallo-hydrolase [Amycolatopsis endophytica]NYI90682.1 glyoxylase-like metal-dependent hydrolase (beta-lactamase superfamily II) [Amycolatopsis endophytica]